MKTKYLTGMILGALLCGGCAGKNIAVTNRGDLPRLVGKRVTVVGLAVHSCPGAVVIDKDFHVIVEGANYWPTNLDRRQVKVTGLLGEERWPDYYVMRDVRCVIVP